MDCDNKNVITITSSLPWNCRSKWSLTTWVVKISPSFYTLAKVFDVEFHSAYTDEGFLKNFIDSTKSLSPDEKGQKLEVDEVNRNIFFFL